MEQIVIIIPALNPLHTLVQFVEKLQKMNVEIVVINDGSDEKYAAVFQSLRQLPRCTVLTHEQNFGKGRALKTGFDYVLKVSRKVKGVVTVGAHGQHSILDVQQMISSTKIFSDGIILGVRDFKSTDMPTSSFFNNRAASMLFELFFHKRLLDTQTGLRYIPKQELLWLRHVPGETFNFDLNMLVKAIKRNIPLYEVPIGHAKLKKNSVIYYDEVLNPMKIIQQIWTNFLRNR
ncbi:glycosyltransferase family 2 protein [Solibacillus sp. FSL H8-0538]|uniref:glycosyltransferase family 2 protein n=1 Tax=Solibacillus sp. FSL H8-0538 TaxID=2921400 RepID=UPI0030F73FC3